MKKILLVLTILVLSNCSTNKEQEFLFVQSGKSATYDGKVLKINNAMNKTILFSDRPKRVTGDVSNKDFATLWNDREKNSFKKDPPNVAISFYDKDGNSNITIVESSNIKVTKDSISYDAKVLEGELPDNMTEVSLFIDGAVMQPLCRTVVTSCKKVKYGVINLPYMWPPRPLYRSVCTHKTVCIPPPF